MKDTSVIFQNQVPDLACCFFFLISRKKKAEIFDIKIMLTLETYRLF